VPIQGESRVFEAVTGGTTVDDGSTFTDYTNSSRDNLSPLGITTENVVWRYLGIVGQLPWDITPQAESFGENSDGPYVAGRHPFDDPDTTFSILAALGDSGNAWEADTLLGDVGYRITVVGRWRAACLRGGTARHDRRYRADMGNGGDRAGND
jgi:hypothetical protein